MRRNRSLLLAGVLALTAGAAMAQLLDADPDWKESEVPPPPAFRADHVIPVDMPRHVSVRMGVDPDTLRITPDGIVRYVMVAQSASGTVNASYEGIRCVTGEVKLYARFTASGSWNSIDKPEWKPLNGNQPSLHALALARQGACDGRGAGAQSSEAIVRKLKSVPSSRS